MPCTSPILGWRCKGGKVRTSPSDAILPGMVRVPCGQCMHCRGINGLNWATRIMCESTLHAENCFTTCTYEDYPGGLVKEHASSWIKRLRERLRAEGKFIRHYTVGEYGDVNHRAHFHSCIFGWWPSEGDSFEIGPRKFSSHLLEDTWGKGRCSVDELTPASAAYVARYVLKKMTGSFAKEWYFDEETGEFCPPEMAVMSRNPGIGLKWFEQHKDEIFPSDKIYFNNGVVSPPKYYFNKLKEVDPSLAERIAAARAAKFDLSEYDRVVWTGIAEEVNRSKMSEINSRRL